jgi:hypothetical protein
MPEEVRHIHENRDARPDSIEIGSATKGGALKVYFNANDPEKAIELIDHSMAVRAYAVSKVLAAQEGK